MLLPYLGRTGRGMEAPQHRPCPHSIRVWLMFARFKGFLSHLAVTFVVTETCCCTANRRKLMRDSEIVLAMRRISAKTARPDRPLDMFRLLLQFTSAHAARRKGLVANSSFQSTTELWGFLSADRAAAIFDTFYRSSRSGFLGLDGDRQRRRWTSVYSWPE